MCSPSTIVFCLTFFNSHLRFLLRAPEARCACLLVQLAESFPSKIWSPEKSVRTFRHQNLSHTPALQKHLTGSYVATALACGTDQTCSKVTCDRTKQWWTPLVQVNGNPLLTYHEIIWDEGLLTPSEPNRASHIEISIHVSILPCLWRFTQSERMHKRSKLAGYVLHLTAVILCV